MQTTVPEGVLINGRELGYLDIPDDAIVDAREINSLPANKVMILCTGSQGEPMADHRFPR